MKRLILFIFLFSSTLYGDFSQSVGPVGKEFVQFWIQRYLKWEDKRSGENFLNQFRNKKEIQEVLKTYSQFTHKGEPLFLFGKSYKKGQIAHIVSLMRTEKSQKVLEKSFYLRKHPGFSRVIFEGKKRTIVIVGNKEFVYEDKKLVLKRDFAEIKNKKTPFYPNTWNIESVAVDDDKDCFRFHFNEINFDILGEQVFRRSLIYLKELNLLSHRIDLCSEKSEIKFYYP